MTKKIAVLLLLISFLSSSAQVRSHQQPTAVITLDTITGLPDRVAPFDESFVVKIPVDTSFDFEDINVVSVYKIFYHTDGSWDLKMHSSGTTYPIYDALPLSPANFQKNGKSYSTLTVTVPPIPPKTPFSIMIQYKYSKEIVNSLIDINNEIYLGSGGEGPMFSALQQRVSNLYKDLGNRVTQTPTSTLAQYKAQLTANGYASHYTNISTALAACGTLTPKVQTLLADWTGAPICNNVFKCNCADDLILQEKQNGIDTLIQQLCFWKTANSAAVAGLALGVYSFYDGERVTTTPPAGVPAVTAGNLKQIIANQTANQAALDKLRDFLLYNSYGATVAARGTLLADILALKTAWATPLQVIKDETTWFKDNLHSLVLTGAGHPLYTITEFVAAEHDMADINTAFGNHLIPDIGVLMMPAFSERVPRMVVRPYWGLNISLRPVNKNKRLRQISYTRAHGINDKLQKFLIRTSISVGFTALPLNKELNHGEDLVNGMSFVNGINVRLNRMLRCGLGYVLYRQDNENPTVKRTVTASPFLSMSIDLDVVNWIGKLSGKFF